MNYDPFILEIFLQCSLHVQLVKNQDEPTCALKLEKKGTVKSDMIRNDCGETHVRFVYSRSAYLM
jgi:hypothetical protein